MHKNKTSRRSRNTRRGLSHCITCGNFLEPDYGETFKCLDCAWWDEQKALRQKGEKTS